MTAVATVKLKMSTAKAVEILKQTAFFTIFLDPYHITNYHIALARCYNRRRARIVRITNESLLLLGKPQSRFQSNSLLSYVSSSSRNRSSGQKSR